VFLSVNKIQMKYIYYCLVVLVLVFACQWCFNHINAWLGIGLSVVIALVIIHFINHLIKKNITNEKDSL